MGIPLVTIEYNKNGGGVDYKTTPNLVDDDRSSDAKNIDYNIDGSFFTRYGSSILNVNSSFVPTPISGNPKTLLMFDYKNSQSQTAQIVCSGTSIYHSLVSPSAQVTGLSASLPYPDIEGVVTSSEELAIWGNGVDANRKYDGTSWTNLYIEAPLLAVNLSRSSGILPVGDYSYYVSFARTKNIDGFDVIVQESDLSPIASITLASDSIITVNLPVSSDSQVNARVIYRISTTSNGIAYRLATVNDNTTLTYNDNDPLDGTIEAVYDNQAGPKSSVFELDDFGSVWYVDAVNKNQVRVSKANQPWSVPTENVFLFDGPVSCIKRCFGVLVFGTDRSIWIQNGSYSNAVPRKVSSRLGILNNRCAVTSDTILYFMATNLKLYAMRPTDFSQDEFRIDNPLSEPISPKIDLIGSSQNDEICMEYYTNADVAKVVISAPLNSNTNNTLLIFNEERAIATGKPVWQVWDNIFASALRVFTIYGQIKLASGDYNGFLWGLDDPSKSGDGAQVNGTATAGTTTTLTDSTKTWTVNAYVGIVVRFIYGTGVNQWTTITANTSTQLTFAPAVAVAADTTTVYTIGGFDHYYFTNWKSITGTYITLKQLWYLFVTFKILGNYSITIYCQYDYNTDLASAESATLSQNGTGPNWNEVNWNAFNWATILYKVKQLRKFARFRAIRIGFYHRKAGEPFYINAFSLSAQDKKLFFPSAD